MRKSASQVQNRSHSVPRPPDEAACGSGKRAVRFLADQQRSPSRERASAMKADPGRYDVDSPSRRRRVDSSSPSFERQDSKSSLSSTNGMGKARSDYGVRHIPAAMKADPARYDVAPRGSADAREYKDKAKHTMHMKADPRNDLLNDGSGHNADGDGQTMIGMEIKERFLDMRTAFIKIDTDFDGRITHDELMQACLDWNIPLSEASRVLNSTDVDGKGFIDFDEFAQRFDPALEVSADDEEMLRLYQEGIMGDEQPIRLAGVQHGTSAAEPLVDESKHYRNENGDLRGRLARAMGQISDLTSDLKVSRANASALEAALDNETSKNRELEGANSELEGRNSVLRRKLQEAEDDKRRMAREMDAFWQDKDQDMAATRMRQEDLDRRSRDRQSAYYEEAKEEEAAERRRLARELAEVSAACRRQEKDVDESGVVFVYGIEGCQKCEAMYKALDKAKVPYLRRDFNKDQRFMKAAKKSGFASTDNIFAPVVCLGDKAWWENFEEGQQLVPFPVEVAMELRHELGLYIGAPEKVREDVDIDTEIFERYLSMQEAFLKLDDNRDGFITEDELVARCNQWNIPTSEARRIISEADRDNKGCLDFDEFAKRFGGMWNNGNRGPLRGGGPAPHQSRPCQPRPNTSPPMGGPAKSKLSY